MRGRRSAMPIILHDAPKIPDAFVSGLAQELEPGPLLAHFGDARPLSRQRPGRAGLDALAPRRARHRVPPWSIEVGNHARLHAAPGQVPGVCPFELVADTHTARTQYT